MASESRATLTLTLHCLCNINTYSLPIPTEKFPLPAFCCHCNKCRHLTGGLYAPHIAIPVPLSETSISFANLAKFEFSERCDSYFCPTCSTPLFFVWQQEASVVWGVFTGALDHKVVGDVDLERVVNWGMHVFVGDTKDGGASMWLRKANADGGAARRFEDWSKGREYAHDWPTPSEFEFTGYERKLEDEIPVRCQCRGVQLKMRRGDYEGKSKEELPWFIDPETKKQIGSFCACDSCRLFSGVDIFHWTYAELKYLSFSNGEPLPPTIQGLKEAVDKNDPRAASLKYYTSREDVQRYFCSTCSGSIFYAVESRPNHVDVAIGAMEASDGARAEGFLSWDFGGGIGDAVDSKGGWREGLMKRVNDECEQWRIERGYPKNWRRLQREDGDIKAHS